MMGGNGMALSRARSASSSTRGPPSSCSPPSPRPSASSDRCAGRLRGDPRDGCGYTPIRVVSSGATGELFEGMAQGNQALAPGAMLLRGFARAELSGLVAALREVTEAAPFRHMTTRGGYGMSVAMTSCGAVGWVTDGTGYRYDPNDPATGRAWPPMPEAFRLLARRAAAACGYPGFEPDSCLLNEYTPGSRLSLHRDADERDFTQPIVSVSLGLPAVFLFGGLERGDRTTRIRLESGDVVVFGGPARLVYHGVAPLADGFDPLLGRRRLNFTFRRAR